MAYPWNKNRVAEINLNLEEYLANYSDHHRLSVFLFKGLSCVVCGLTGNKIIHWYDRSVVDVSRGGLHIDLFADDTMMTVDHIVPKSLGGKDNLINKQPMCAPCNSEKASIMSEQDKMIALINLFSMAHLK